MKKRILILAWVSAFVFLNVVVFAKTPEQIYNEGKRAYDMNDYLKAVKLLYAYKEIMRDDMDQSSAGSLVNAIDHCDKKISYAIKTRKELDEKGTIKEIVVTSEGAADAGGDYKKKKYTYKYPEGEYYNLHKPSLSTYKPAKKSGSKTLRSRQSHARRSDKIYKNKYYGLNKKYNVLQERYNDKLSDYDRLVKKIKAMVKEFGVMKMEYDRLQIKYKEKDDKYAYLISEYKLLMMKYDELKKSSE